MWIPRASGSSRFWSILSEYCRPLSEWNTEQRDARTNGPASPDTPVCTRCFGRSKVHERAFLVVLTRFRTSIALSWFIRADTNHQHSDSSDSILQNREIPDHLSLPDIIYGSRHFNRLAELAIWCFLSPQRPKAFLLVWKLSTMFCIMELCAF